MFRNRERSDGIRRDLGRKASHLNLGRAGVDFGLSLFQETLRPSVASNKTILLTCELISIS